MRIFPFPIPRISALALMLLPGIAAPAAAQTPEDLYFGPLEARLAGGASLDDVLGVMESAITDIIPAPVPACAPIPPGGFPGATSQRFYYLTEILPPGIPTNSPACGVFLGCFLDQVPGTVHDLATLVIDRECRVQRTLVVPDRYVLAGTGLDGAGRLTFDLPGGARALRFRTPGVGEDPVLIRHAKIRDLTIGNLVQNGQIGIDLSASTLVEVDSVNISGFGFGIFGRLSFFNTVESSNLHNNGVGIRLGLNTTTWQINESSIGRNRLTAIGLHAETRAAVISGNVIEKNLHTGIFLRGTANVVQNNWFEGNGDNAGDFAIIVPPAAEDARILSNLFSDNDILDAGTNSRRCFNSHPFTVLIPDNCP